MAEVTPTPVPTPVVTPTNPWLEAAKELLRLVVFACPGIAIQVLASHPTLTTSAVGAIILMLLRATDKAIHDNPNTSRNGILPF